MMRTPAELHKARQVLVDTPVGDLTIGQLYERIKELQYIERQLHQLEHTPAQVSDVPVAIPKSVQVQDSSFGDASVSPTSRKRVGLSEQNVGRYVMTILAATLCILALGVFVTSFWAALPNIVKFLFFFLLGAALEIVGFKMVAKQQMRPFWLGIAGLGASTTLLIIVAGCMVWWLYDIMLTGVLMSGWFVLNYVLACRQKAAVFYIISYIGAFITTALSCLFIAPVMLSEVVIAVLVGVILLVGFCGYYKVRNKWLLLANIAYCWVTCTMVVAAYQGSMSSAPNLIDTLHYEVILLPWALMFYVVCCQVSLRCLSSDDTWGRVLRNAVLVFINSCVLVLVSNFAHSGTAGSVLALIALLACSYKSCNGYFIGCSLLVLSLLKNLSQIFTELFNASTQVYTCSALLPSLVTLCLCVLPEGLRNKYTRMGFVIFSCGVLQAAMFPDYRSEHLLYFISFVLLLASFTVYTVSTGTKQLYFHKPMDILGLCLVSAALVHILVAVDLLPESTSVVYASVALQLYGALYLLRQPEEEYEVTQIVWRVFRVLVYVAALGSAFFATDTTRVLITVQLLFTTAFNMYQLVAGKKIVQTVVTCIMAHWHLFFLSSLWSISMQLPVSLVGLLIGAGFIVLGFKLKHKAARQCGHLCCIVYAMKMGLFDATAGGLGTAGGLLLAGVVCFCISLIYNRVEKRQVTAEEKSEHSV